MADAASRPSLVDALRSRVRKPAAGRARLSVAWVVGILLALGPTLTWAGASIMAARARSQAATIVGEAADQIAARRQEDAARTLLSQIVTRPGVAATLAAYARALPSEARLASEEVDSRGVQRAAILVPDPDALRQALRADPGTRSLRESGPRAGEGGMMVTLEGAE